jgi:hypothetical protein
MLRMAFRAAWQRLGITVTSLLCFCFAGCSVHPMLEDVSHTYRTEEIVRHLRCEMKDAIIASIEATSKYKKNFGSSGLFAHFDRILAVKKEIDNHNKPIANPQNWKKYSSRLSKEELELMVYTEVAVAYDLNFDILESVLINATLLQRPGNSPEH